MRAGMPTVTSLYLSLLSTQRRVVGLCSQCCWMSGLAMPARVNHIPIASFGAAPTCTPAPLHPLTFVRGYMAPFRCRFPFKEIRWSNANCPEQGGDPKIVLAVSLLLLQTPLPLLRPVFQK